MKYKTCVTVAEKTPEKMRQSLDKALSKSDYAELRLDYLPPKKVPDALHLARRKMHKTVCTLRPKSDGGRFPGSESERIRILKLIAEYERQPFLLDVEYETLRKNPRLARYLRTTGTDILVSWHDHRTTPSSAMLEKQLARMSKMSRHVKMVSTAKTTADATRMLQLYSKKGRTGLVSFAMGDRGRISRVLCLFLGSPFTYVSLGRAVAPGQFSIDEMKSITSLRV